MVVRDASGAYTWKSTVETKSRSEIEPKLLKSMIRRRSTNKVFNMSLYEADVAEGEGASTISEHKGPAWYKNSR